MTPAWSVRGRVVSIEHPIVMGIVNVTPDSFSDGGDFLDPDNAVGHCHRLLADGADILDIGGESTRPQGARAVSTDEELRRVLPVIRAMARARPDVLLSVDTVKGAVADAAIDAGVHIVNDVSGLRLDPDMAGVCARHRAGVVLMHSRGSVEDMATYAQASYDGDPVDEVVAELRIRIRDAREAGVESERIALDPGIGFSKRSAHSLRILGCLDRVSALGFPVVIGASRKRFIGEIATASEPQLRVHGSVGASVAAYHRGARIFRVHDVLATRQALDVAAAIRSAGCA